MSTIKILSKCFLYIGVLAIIMISTKAILFYPDWWFNPNPNTTDEQVWRNVTIHPFSAEAQSLDNKSPVFLWVMHILQIDQTVSYTRLLNVIIYTLITCFIYLKTKRLETMLIPVFVWYTDVPILYDVTFELSFILLAVTYPKYNGVFVGLAGIFRPYAFMYTVLLSKKNALITVGIGLMLVVVMYWTGGLVPYWYEVTVYGNTSDPLWLRFSTVFESLLILSLAVLTWNPKNKAWQFACLSCLPLLLRTYGHYYIVSTVLFGYLYLLQLSENQKLKNQKN